MVDLAERLKSAVEQVVTDPTLCRCADRVTFHGIHFASNCSIFKLALRSTHASARGPAMTGVYASATSAI